MRAKTVLITTVGAGILLSLAVRAASGETLYGTRDRPLEGRHYEVVRGLAQHVDETAQGALEGAADDARRGSGTSARFLSSIRAFARRADGFHRSMDGYQTEPFEVPTEVTELTARARSVNDRLRSAQALESTYDDWDAILDVLERMKHSLAGRDVEVPTAHVVPPLAGPRLAEFRQLAQDLGLSATRAHEGSLQHIGDYPSRGQQFLGELGHFAVQSRTLSDLAITGQVDPQRIGPLVDQVLEDARLADRRMRDARVFPSVWADSGRTITILHRMATLVRS
jgi:hypothetical protein